MAKKKEVLLVKDVLKVGNMGDLVRVAPGFARNYLFPYGLAVSAEGAAKRQIEVLREKAAKAETEREAKAVQLKQKMLGLKLSLKARVSHDDVLFGSIGTKELVAALAAVGYQVDSKQIHLHDKLRKLGTFTVEVRLHKNVPVEVQVEIVNADPNAPTLAERIAAREARAKADAEAKAAADEAPAEGEEKDKKGKKADKAEKPAKAEKAAKTDKKKG
jgi:large subunit ribosomal protein L9